MEWLSDPTIWIGLATLIVLEIVLGIDNLIFIAILADKLPPEQRDRARLNGLGLALFMRLGLLFSISWLVSWTQPLFTLFSIEFSGRDLILIGGGVFLLIKATIEMHEHLPKVWFRRPSLTGNSVPKVAENSPRRRTRETLPAAPRQVLVRPRRVPERQCSADAGPPPDWAKVRGGTGRDSSAQAPPWSLRESWRLSLHAQPLLPEDSLVSSVQCLLVSLPQRPQA